MTVNQVRQILCSYCRVINDFKAKKSPVETMEWFSNNVNLNYEDKIRKWLTDQDINGSVLAAKFQQGEDSFVKGVMNGGLPSGPATELYNALATFLQGSLGYLIAAR